MNWRTGVWCGDWKTRATGGLSRRSPATWADRRVYLLEVTTQAKEVLKAVGQVAREHQDALLAALNAEERDRLASLLLRVADQQGLRPGVHPGFARLRPDGRRASRTTGEPKPAS